MKNQRFVLAGAGAVAAVTVVLFGFGYAVVRLVQGFTRARSLAPGDVPVTPVELNGAPVNPCRAVMQWQWHLRPVQQLDTEGAAPYPQGTEVLILQRGTITRWGAAMYKVRVLRDSAEGWAFVQPYELHGDCTGRST